MHKIVYNSIVMKVGIYFNKNYISDNMSYIDRITEGLASKGIETKIVQAQCDLNDIDILFVLGGDGTILTIASECAQRNIKIIGINYGHVGFLAEFEPELLDDAIRLVCDESYAIEERSMLRIEAETDVYYALNDVVLQRNTCGNQFSNTVSLHAEIDGTTVDNFSSDGIIISTPTGSTAYSLAAGGSVLAPDIRANIMTPICAHSLHSKPIVFSDNATVKLSSLSPNTALNVVVDGRVVKSIAAHQIVTVKKAEFSVKFITTKNSDFYRKLLIKLSIWSK